jgi:hypothetical protein
MSTIKSSAENLTLNADGANNDIIFQSNGSNVATLDQAGLLTATSFAGSGASLTALPAANLTGTLPAISGASLTGIVTAPNNYFSSSTKVGWSDYTTNRAYLWITVVGKLMNVSWHIEGTSNSATTSFSLPHAIVAYGVVNFSAPQAYGYQNSTSELGGLCRMDSGGTVVTVTRPSGSWATSGAKITAGTFSVPIA